ncbi:MAG TPA: TonB-dependent receptor [Nevskiaceae bacterium]|nr:TonB-dependent receptor [Nevskiaceae bacterium]
MGERPILAAFLIGASVTALADEAPQSPQPYEQTVPVTPTEAKEPTPPKEKDDAVKLDDVVVTANKRKESTRTLAGAVSAITRERLDETGSSSMADYLSLSPGVNFNSGTPGYSVITIRGINSDTIPNLAQTAVGSYYDDIPLTDPAAPMVVPDIDAFDADRIEVLRGPQGALFGSASLGGAVNYIPQSPDPYNFKAAAQAVGDLKKNSSLGGTGKLMLNTPLFVDGLGLRAAGYYTKTPGWIDNVGLDREESNSSKTWGGRAILGYSFSPESRLRLTGLYQRTMVDDAGYVDPTLGDLKKTSTQLEPSENTIRLYSLRYEHDTGFGSFTLIGGYQDKEGGLGYDAKNAFGAQATGNLAPLILTQYGLVKGYSAELRYVSPRWDHFDFLTGLSYANRNEQLDVILDSQDLVDTLALLHSVLDPLQIPIQLPSTVTSALTVFREHASVDAPEAAAFIDGSWPINDSLKLTAGGRYYHNVVDSRVFAQGVVVLPGGSTEYTKDNHQVANGFNPKVSLAYQATKRLLLYALYSRGYRLGGPNLVPSTTLTPTKQFYNPDEVRNYELGAKTNWLKGRLTVDLAGFWIDWKDIPLVIQDQIGLFKYIDNVGDARSRGLETSLSLRPLPFVTLRSSVTWLDSRLLNDYDPNNGRPPAKAGDRLPGAPAWTVSNVLTGTWLWGNHVPTLSLIHRYESASATNLSFQDIQKGNFHLLDARASAKLGAFGVVLYGKNLIDARAVQAANNYANPATGDVASLKYISPPRAFGVELSYAFE